MKNIMLDLEFMDISSNAAIAAIGAVEFDLRKGTLGKKFYRIVDLRTSVENGGTMGADTVLWWLKQSDEARAELNKGGVHINTALTEFSMWVWSVSDGKQVSVWGNGAATDNVILSNAYVRSKLAPPWSFRNDRCYRTACALFPELPFERVGARHNALNDAESQALHLIKISQGSYVGVN